MHFTSKLFFPKFTWVSDYRQLVLLKFDNDRLSVGGTTW